MCTRSRYCRVRRVKVPPCGMASIAFSTRLEIARCSSSGSAAIGSKSSVNSSRLSLGLDQLFLLLQQFPRHAVKCFSEVPHFIARGDLNLCIEISRSDLADGRCQVFHGACDPCRCPTAEQDRQQNSRTPYQHGGRLDVTIHLNIRSARTADQQNAQRLVVRSSERNRV